MAKSLGLEAYKYWTNAAYRQRAGAGVGVSAAPDAPAASAVKATTEATRADVLDTESVLFEDAPLASEALYTAHMHRSPSEVTVSTGVSGNDEFVSCLNGDFGGGASPQKREAAENRPDDLPAAGDSGDSGSGRLRVGGVQQSNGTPSPPERESGEHEHAIHLGSAAPGAEDTIERLKRQLDVANAGLVVAGVVVITVCIVSRGRFWWIGTLVELVGWIDIIGTLLGATTVVQVVVGHMGRVLFSRAILHMYVLSFTVTGLSMITIGIICVPYYYRVDEMVSENWDSLTSIIPEEMSLRQVQDRLRSHLVTMACTLMSCAAYAALPHGLALRLRTLIGQSDQVQRSECNVLRARHALHQYASLVSMVAGVVGIGYGLWAVKLSIRVRFHLFITYSNLALAIMVMLAAAFGLACAHPQIISHGRTYGVYFRTAMPALVGALCVFTVVTFSYITDVRPQLVASWDAVVQDYPDRNLATEITWQKLKLMIMGAMLVAQAGSVSFTTFNAVRLEQQYLWCKEMPGFDPTMVNAGLFMRLTEYAQEKIIWWQPGWVDSCLILWNTTMGLGQIFWIGQYVLFAEFIKNRAAEGEDGSSALFLHDWFVYGRADSRYIEADPFIVSMETVVVLLIGPLSLLFAWTSFMRGPFRDVLGVVVGSLQIQLGLLYMLTSIINRGRNLRAAGEKDVVWYWAWMVCIAIVRFVVPVPIALRSVFNIARIVRQHDWSEATQRIPPSSTVVSPRTADAEHPNPNRRSSPPQAARARDGTPTDSLRSDSGISEQVHVLPSGTDKGGLPTWRCRVLRASHGDDTHPAA